MTHLPRLPGRRLLLAVLLAFYVTGWHAHAAPPPTEPAASAALVAAIAPDESGTLFVLNRPIVTFRGTQVGLSPAERVRRAHGQLQRAMDRGGPGVVTLAPVPEGQAVLVDGVRMFSLRPDDLDTDGDPKQVVAALQLALAEAREARTPTRLLRALGVAVVVSMAFGAGIWLLLRLRRRLEARLREIGERHAGRLAIGGAQLLGLERIYGLVRLLTQALFWVVLLFGASEWLGFVMLQFPYTRRWGENLHASAVALVEQVFEAIASSIPGLAVAVVMFVLARALLGLMTPLFTQVERGELTLKWVDQDTVRSTRGLVHLGVWLFTLAMAYPYLPGAQTEAFRGMSVMLGLMVSLGASNILGQAISGLIITYSHTMRVGEYVRVGDVEGTVTATGTFATRVHTGRGVELTLPNTLIVSSVTKNYSRAVNGPGYIVDTAMTIGYDTPWRQVHAMMIEGARRTEGVLAAPPPRVYQTALNDFYVEYWLVAQAAATQPRPRAEVLNQLHGNLQDVFNENGVQIMSPHYMYDPEQAKVVPPAQWNPPTTGVR